jgi:hypothetical protein
MATLIYEEQAGDKLKLLAEVGEDNVELAVDALLDEEPKLASHQPFVCFPSESRMVVEAGEEIVQPRRTIKINGQSNGNGRAAAPKRQTRTRRPAPQVEQGEVETDPEPATEAPTKPAARSRGRGSAAKKGSQRQTAGGRSRGRAAAKPAAAKPASATGAKKSPFTRNPASDE